ncbi:serine/arginine repetitive matrix protein 2 isoform X2 [Coregonus clupeaformis]|uniref:serine/arginine repetitive matrix protein 2 isoform X2 n=1 Tax=Coregonus clupeaformis TaxID=59861 RepID=UPI001BE0D6C4|nr:serine/arginine repetitive matrix protein 2 isoform X2 [Coregonus clupeaformis]
MKQIQSKGNGRSIADYFSTKSSTGEFKDIIPLGSPRPKPSPAPSSLQETPMKPSQPPGRLSNPNTYPLPKRVLPLTSHELDKLRAKPVPGLPPHPPHPPGLHHRASGGGGGGEAKDGPANFTNTLTRKIQHSHRPQTPHSPVTPNPSRGTTFNPRGGMGRDNPLSPPSIPPCRVSAPSRRRDYGAAPREDMNKNLKVGSSDIGSSRPLFPAAQTRRLSVPPTVTSRPGQSSQPQPSPYMDPRSPESSPAERRHHFSQKLSQSLQSIRQYKVGGDGKESTMRNGGPLSPTTRIPVTPQQSRGSLDHRGTTPSNERFTPGGTRSLSLKRLRHPDLEGRNRGIAEYMANKRLRPGDYIPGPISTSHPSYGTASSKMSPSPNPSYLKKVFMKNSLSSSPTLRLKERLTPKKTEEGMESGSRTVPTYPLSTPKPARQRCTGHGQTPCCNSVRENGNPQAGYRRIDHQSGNTQSFYSGSNPQTGNHYSQSGNPANLPVTIPSRGECSRDKEARERESRGGEPTGRPDGRTPKSSSKSQSSDSSCPSFRRRHALEKNRHVSVPRRTSALPDDLNDLFTPDPITSSPSRAAITFSPSPQRGDGSPSVHNKVPLSVVLATVSSATMGPGSPSLTSPREIPPKSLSQRILCPKISPCTDTAMDPCKLLLDPKIYSSFVRLEMGRNDLTKLETGLYRAITSTPSSSGKPSSCKEESVKMEDVASGLKTRSPGIALAGLESPMDEDENSYLKTESSVLKTIPLSASAKSSSSCNDKSFSMETADLKISPTSPLDQHGQGKEGEERKEGDQKFHKSLLFFEEGEERSKKENSQKSLPFLEEDPLDVELGLGLDLSLGLELALSQTSSSSDEDQLPSLQQILDLTARPPDTPEKGTFPAPSSPVGLRHHSQPPSSSKAKPTSYRNNLDEMLKEKETIQRSKEMEAKLRLSCKENLLRLAEEEEEEENIEAISQQQKEFLQRFSVLSSAIQDLHSGEAVFSLDNFGRLFSQHTLQLRHCNVTPCDTTQKTILWSSPDQFRTQVSSQLFQRAYRSSPCPPQVARWLFQMMSVHSDKLTCHQVLKALGDIACSAAEHMVLNKSERYEVWVPSVGDVTLVFMNMGVPFVTLFPLENLQPPFTEGDLIEGIQISTESLSSKKLRTFPEHNFDNVIKYMCHCTSLCPRAYSDRDLLLLLTVVSRVGLDTQLTLQPTEHLRSLLHNLVNSIRDLDSMLPRICMSLVDLTEDHHNLRWLVELLPDSMRGKQLRRHISVSAISKLLNKKCTYIPSNTEFQLSDLRPYLSRMRPSSLLRGLATSCSRRSPHPHREREGEEEEEDCASLDQQAYYLCYSLLALANEATNFEFFPSEQKNQLLLLSAELEKHIKSDIRESEKMLYRSKVKDFVARIYTKWQVLVHRTRPLQGKLYDYWQPLPEDAVSSSQESQHSHREREVAEERGERVMEVEGEEDEGDEVGQDGEGQDKEERTPEKHYAMEEAEERKDIQGEEED